jgi:hypothetical protein
MRSGDDENAARGQHTVSFLEQAPRFRGVFQNLGAKNGIKVIGRKGETAAIG